MTLPGVPETSSYKHSTTSTHISKKNHQIIIVPLHPSPSNINLNSTSLPMSITHSPTRLIIKTLIKTILQLLLKLWRWASSFLVLIFLAAWFYGGFLPYALFIMAVLSLGYNVSDYLLYQPDFPQESRIFVASPDQYGIPHEEIWIYTKDRVKLHAYLLKQMVPNSRSIPIMIFHHGNAGNIGSRLENAKLLFKEVKCHILLLEYRGYGRSEGTPSENGLYQDAQAAFEFVDAREDLDSHKVFLFGRSLGGAVAIDLAARCDLRDRISGLIVENSFTSIPAIAKHLFPIRPVRWLPKFCYKNKFDSLSKVSAVVCPTLFISGTEDELIPEAMMSELYNKCSSSFKRLIHFQGGHNDTWLDKSYPHRVAEFMSEALDPEKRRKFQSYSDDNVV